MLVKEVQKLPRVRLISKLALIRIISTYVPSCALAARLYLKHLRII